jgi:aspartyl-tRNA(Asn)/glutamyl-tRNA(Gln) amidotransferase subunit A
MQKLGAAIEEITVPDGNAINSAARIVQLSETAAVYADATDPSLFSPELWDLLQRGRQVSGHDYVNAQRLREVFGREWEAIWNKVEVIATPTTPTPAPLLEQSKINIGGQEEDVRMASTRLMRSLNYLGEPALSMPCGKTSGGLPIGLQLISARNTDARLLQIAKTLEPELRFSF